jgi:hypothetical protein
VDGFEDELAAVPMVPMSDVCLQNRGRRRGRGVPVGCLAVLRLDCRGVPRHRSLDRVAEQPVSELAHRRAEEYR